MPRSLKRCCLQDGLKLDINNLVRRHRVVQNGLTRSAWISWTNNYWGTIATGSISADMSGERYGWFKIQLSGSREERIERLAEPRHFGGRQWYFLCPETVRRCTVLWRPKGAARFASREAWGNRRVAYRSQFLDRDNRAHHAQAKIKSQLCEIGGFDPDEWDLPPKPKRMRHKTYERIEALYNHQEGILDSGVVESAVAFLAK